MLDIFYPTLRAFARDCRACGLSARELLRNGEYSYKAEGVFAAGYF